MQQVSILKDSMITYRIEPFYLENDPSNLQELDGFKTLAFTKEMFYEHINQLMFLQERDQAFENQICKAYRLTKDKQNPLTYYDSYEKKELPFPMLGTEYRYVVEVEKDKNTKEVIRKRYIRFTMEDVQLLISEMQVGFLVYDLNVLELYDEINGEKNSLPLTLENYEWAMYYLRKLQNAKKGFLHKYIKDPVAEEKKNQYYIRQAAAFEENLPFNEEEPPKVEFVAIPIKWADLTMGLLKQLGEVHSFSNKEKIGYHTLLYSSAFVETPELAVETVEEKPTLEEFEFLIANKVYKLSHGFKGTYQKNIQVNDILRPFDNVMWCVSSEGISNIVYSVENKQTMKFFHSSFKNKRTTNYYFMYILALLQKYSLLYFTINTSDLLFQSSIYSGEELSKEEREMELQRTRNFHGKMLKFIIHGYYEQVSYHTHYNEMYEQLITSLRIPELRQELTPKMEAFHQVIELLVHEQNEKEKELAKEEVRKRREEEEREKEEEKRAQAKQNNVIQTITYILLPATIATGFLGMNIPFITKSTNFYLGYTLLGIILITVFISIYLKKGWKWFTTKKIIIGSVLVLIAIIVADIVYDPPKKANDKPTKIQIELQTEDR